jgi:predicted amidophosphoribosyltransferase
VKKIKKGIISSDEQYTCLWYDHDEQCIIYRNVEGNHYLIKKIYGDGVFLNDSLLLMFYNNSGYGYLEGDCYLYNIETDKIIPFYHNTFEELCINNHAEGYFISFSSNILVTSSFVIMKDEYGGVYFYKKNDIILRHKLDFFYYQPEDRLEKLLDFDETKNILRYSDYEDSYVKEKVIDFNQSSLLAKESISLKIKSDFYYGYSLDYHTISCTLNNDGTFTTIRTVIGELLYQLKYKGNLRVIENIAKVSSMFIKDKFHSIDVIIPIPPSNKNRNFQPVLELGKAISSMSGVMVDANYLKKRETSQLKSIDDNERRKIILKNAFFIFDTKYKNKTILLFDDLYRSGETLNAAARVLKEIGKVGEIYCLTITKTRTKR